MPSVQSFTLHNNTSCIFNLQSFLEQTSFCETVKLHRHLILKLFFIQNPAQGTTCVLKILHVDTIAVKQFVQKAHSRTPLTKKQTKPKTKIRKSIIRTFPKLLILSSTDILLQLASQKKTIQRFKQWELVVSERERERA